MSDKESPVAGTISEARDRAAFSLDFESDYATKVGYSLAKMPTWMYCADERFNPYLVSLCGWEITDDGIFGEDWEEGKVVTKFTEKGSMFRKLPDGRQLYVGRPENFPDWENLKGRITLSHNNSFDKCAAYYAAKKGLMPMYIFENEWACTADMSTYMMAPRNLKGACKELLGLEVSKEVRASLDGKHDWELSPDEYRALVEYGGSDAVECHDLWLKYSKDWPYMERRISQLNCDSTLRGIRLDVDYCKRALKELESYLSRVLCDVPWYPEKAAGSLPALKQAVLSMGLTLPKSFKKDDPGFLRWVDKNGNIPFIKARQKAISIQMCIARLKTMVDYVDGDRSHVTFLYGGAHTLRFTGKGESAGGVNLLNLPRKPVMAGDEHVFGGEGVKIRECYMADPGYKFAVYDYSQIERRFVLWAVDDQVMLEGVKREGNLYEASAVTMGWCQPHAHIKKTDPQLYLKAKQCLTGDTLVLVRTEKKSGGLTSPYYKRIMCVETSDRVWDGHEWVRHLGVKMMKEVGADELVERCGVCCTKDHRIYCGEHEAREAGAILGDEEAAAVAWGEAACPVQGWAHVRVLAAALARACARLGYVAIREALCVLAGKVSLHGVRDGNEPFVGERSGGAVDQVHQVCAQGGAGSVREPGVGEAAR